MSSRGSITASVEVTNTGTVAGDEVAQLYIHDPVASISQPVRRLRGFERVTLAPGRDDDRDAGSWTRATSASTTTAGKFRVEPGLIEVYAGNSSSRRSVR